ncbi:hypothetical protein REH65_33145 (plasmid) [Saccharopolyspora sp. ID03-671]|uniref:hypothetical protein n=1 Tax=Saccharopolyspora sp. ID03-671 TaxID=3073066 RepID=UPI00324D2D48
MMGGQHELTPRVPAAAMSPYLRITGELYTGEEFCTDVELMRRVRDGLVALPDTPVPGDGAQTGVVEP